MNIFTKIKNSIYNKEYYKSTVLTESFGESIKYVIQVALVFALFASVFFAFLTPKILNSIKEMVSSVVVDYPEDLVVSIKNGKASVNRPEPYFVKVRKSFMGDGSIENMMVINTTESFDSLKFKEYKTFSLLTKNEIVVIEESGEIKILPLSNFGNIEISKSWIIEKQDWLFKSLPWFMVGMFFLLYIGIFFLEFIVAMVTLLLYALMVWLILKIKKIDVSYGRAYQVAAHAGTIIMPLVFFGLYLKPLNNIFLKLAILAFIVYLNFDRVNLTLNEDKEGAFSVDFDKKTE